MRIAICHQTFASGDAIGRDIAGMAASLSTCGHDPFVLCEHSPRGPNGCTVSQDFSDAAIQSCDLAIYHHSQDWIKGLDLLHRFRRPVIFKFHNITPPQFFAGYCQEYEATCRHGLEMTRLLTHWPRPHIWLADSDFNRADLLQAGAAPQNCHVAPPFNHCERLLHTPNRATATAGTTRFLFVGRFAPNKGHLHLARFANSYQQLFGSDFEIVIVGSIDAKLRRYWDEFTALARTLGVAERFAVYPHVSDRAVHDLLLESHIYLTFSEHEGFCVPIIEAQAVGLPVVGSGATAVRETAGHGQFLGAPPACPADYEFYAELAQRAAQDQEVRNVLKAHGYRNVLARFGHHNTENAFLYPLLAWLNPVL